MGVCSARAERETCGEVAPRTAARLEDQAAVRYDTPDA